MKKLIAIVLSLVPLIAWGSASTAAKNAPYSSRCFAAYPRQPTPDIAQDTGTNYLLELIDFFGNVEPGITDVVCGALTTAWTVTGGVPGLAVDATTIPKKPKYTGTISGGAASGTVTYHVDNNVTGTAEVTDAAAWAVTAVAGSATPIPLDSHAYFLDPVSGADSNNGQTPNTAWRSFGKANGFAFAPDDDLWIKAGIDVSIGMLAPQLRGIDETHQGILGSYYVVAGQPYQNTPTNFTISTRPRNFTYTVARPIIRGSYHDSCRQSGVGSWTMPQTAWQNNPLKCAFNTAHDAGDIYFNAANGPAVPASRNSSLVGINLGANTNVSPNGHDVVIQDLDVRDSAGSGIGIGFGDYWCLFNYPCIANAIIQRNKADLQGGSPSIGVGSLRRAIIRYNEASRSDFAIADGNTLNGVEGGAIAVVGGIIEAEVLIEANDVHDSYNESVGNYFNAAVLVRGQEDSNTWVASVSHGSYANVVVEQNLTIGGAINPIYEAPGSDWAHRTGKAGRWGGMGGLEGGGQYLGGGYWGSWNTTSPWRTNENFVSRNNVVAADQGVCLGGIYTLASGDTSQDTNGWNADARLFLKFDVLGNTCITGPNADVPLSIGINGDPSAIGQNHVANNMVVWGGSAKYCGFAGGRIGTVAHDHNFFSAAPTDSACDGAGNVISANHGLPMTYPDFFNGTTREWPDIPTIADFTPSHASAARAAGAALTSVLIPDDPVIISGSIWDWMLAHRMWLPACNTTGAQVPKSEWVKGLTTDFCGNARPGTPTIGAVEAP